MTQPAAVADKPVLHCFKCRDRRAYTRMLPSRPVYSCDGCGNTREILELGRVEIRGQDPFKEPHVDCKIRNIPPIPINHTKKETTKIMDEKSKRSPLQAAIDAAVKEQLEPIRDLLAELKKEIRALDDKDDDKERDHKLNELFEDRVPELVQQAVLQMLATPSTSGAHGRRTRPTDTAVSPGECRHKNFMRKCASCQARHAAEDDE